MKKKFSFLFFVTLFVLGFCICKPVFPSTDFDWVKIETPTNPVPARSYTKTVYDPLVDKIVLFGGTPANDVGLNDLWEYDGETWEQKFPLYSPEPRAFHNMTYDSNRNVIVLFGGEDWPTLYGDTWEYDGNTWKKINTAHSPISRAHYALAYDSSRNVTVLFGGWHSYVDQGDTWEYDGTDWIQAFPVNSPCVRQQVSMVYDEYRGVIVLFGGKRQYANQGGPFSDTWEWDGTNWIEKHPQHNPTARAYHQMTYDSDQRKVILYGGKDSTGYKNDVWQYDGNDWTLVTTENSPENRSGTSFCYFPKKNSTVLFGGHLAYIGRVNDTWELVSLTQNLEAKIDIKPDTLNVKSKGKKVTAYIELPDGYDVNEIDTTTIAIIEVNGTVLSEPIYSNNSPTSIGDYDLDGIFDLMVKFSRSELISFINSDGESEIVISGKLIDDTSFSGSDLVRIKN